LRALEPGERRGKAEGMGRTTGEIYMTKQQYHLEALAAQQFALLMMRLGVGMNFQSQRKA
jgi:hypothetical protein